LEKAGPEPGKSNLTITEARALLPESLQREIRLRARNLAWQTLVPEEAFDRNPLPEAVQISETIAHIQEHLQERASIAQTARNDFVAERIRSSETGRRESGNDNALFHGTRERREQLFQSVFDSFSSDEARRLAELDRFAAQTREDVYRAFELLDAQRCAPGLVRAQVQPSLPEVDVSHRKFQTQSARSFAAGSERSLAMSFDKEALVVAAELQTEKIAIRSGESAQAVPSIRVQSDQVWRLDSLREVLRVEMNAMPSETPEREAWQYHQTDRSIVQER
jgi:hypothetical protein